MATKELLAQLKLRKDTAANWTEKNPVIGNGEMVIVDTSSGEQRFKVGDGEKTFTQLPYTDETLLSKIKTYSAGDGIAISNEGVISSDSDVFIIEVDEDTNEQIISDFDEIKNAIENKKVLVLHANELMFPVFGSYDSDATIGEFLILGGEVTDANIEWRLIRETGTSDVIQKINQYNIPTASFSNPPASGAAYWNASNKTWEIKDIASSSTTQSNWQQNDSTAADYVQNRPGAYDAQTTAFTLDYDLTTESDTVIFDSNGKPNYVILGKTLPGGNIHNFDTSTVTITSNVNGTTQTNTFTCNLGIDYTGILVDLEKVECYYYIGSQEDGTIKQGRLIYKYNSAFIDAAVSNGSLAETDVPKGYDSYLLNVANTETHLTITQTADKTYTVPLDAKYNLQDIYTTYGSNAPIRIANNCVYWEADWGSNISVTNNSSNGHQIIDAKVPKYTAGDGISIASSGSNYIISATGSSSAEELCAEVTLGEKDTSKSIGEWVLVYPGTVANSVTYDQALAAFNSNTPVKIRVTSAKTISGVSIPIISEAYMTRYIAAQNALIFDYVHNATDLSVSSGGIVWTSDGTITCYTATYSFAFSSTDTSATSVQVPTTTKVQDMIDAAVSNIDTSGGGGSVAGGYTIQVSNAAPATGTSNKIITYVVEDA